MRKNIRIIPRLDIKGANLVKGINLEGLRMLGKPEDFAYQYYSGGADELLYLDIVASLYGRNNLLEIVKATAEKIFIPLTVAGGLRSIDDMRKMLLAGADKIAINTAAVKQPSIISEGARMFGSQCVVLSIEAKRVSAGKYEAYTDNGRERTGLDVFEWAKQAVDLGAGEILVTAVDREGTGTGFDIELLSKISKMVNVPVIGCGGAGSKEDFLEAIVSGCADAVSAASVFHYNLMKVNDGVFRSNPFSNTDDLKARLSGGSGAFGKIKTFSISELKKFLGERIADREFALHL